MKFVCYVLKSIVHYIKIIRKQTLNQFNHAIKISGIILFLDVVVRPEF
jgi:hypothetical protein